MRRQRGWVGLLVVLALLAGTSLAWLYSHRALLTELQTSGEHLRSVTAFHAAQAGQDWVLAMLNDLSARDGVCQVTEANDPSFRDRYLAVDSDDGHTQALSMTGPRCGHTGNAWSCSCPSDAGPANPSPVANDGADHPQFALQWESGPSPWEITVLSIGCTDDGTHCSDRRRRQGWGRAQVRQTYTPLGRWKTRPPASAVASGRITLGAGSRVAGTEASLLIASGEAVERQPGSRLDGSAGTPESALVAEGSSPIRRSMDDWLRALFDLPGAWWRRLPTVQWTSCPGGVCSSAEVQTALEASPKALWIDGDLNLDAGHPLGSARRPVLMVISGQAALNGAVEGWGLILASRLLWRQASTAGPPGHWHGTLLSASTLELQGTVQVIQDPATVDRALSVGTAWVPVPGSWREVPAEDP